MTTTLHNDGFPNAIAFAPSLVSINPTSIPSSNTNANSTLTSSSSNGGLNLPALIGGVIGGVVVVCFLCGMIYFCLKLGRRWYNRRNRGIQAPQAPINDVNINTSQYVPPSPVDLSINLSLSINAGAAAASSQEYNNDLLYPYEIFNLDIEDAPFPEVEEEPAVNSTTGTLASAPRFPRDYNNPPAYSL